ncbi:Acg family FMN-binding oxidoreductase [Antrihabitans sp. NCIMB 15449]|uniref:Acg family FMN-binding oxidoreductase n=1 Tax=Antrihabitans spumae TaxID=3373370 RepID=A0ABW7JUA5_9NOCA
MGTVPTLDRRTIESAVTLTCRAPSLHNSQPWHWTADGDSVHLYCASDRLLPSTDAFGRQMIISCGAALDHLGIAFAAHGRHTTITRMPDGNRDHLARIDVGASEGQPSPETIAMAAAIADRRSDRLPLCPPSDPEALTKRLRDLVSPTGVRLELLGRNAHAELIHASSITASRRQRDSMYQDELYWWTGESALPDGVPKQALVSPSEHERVAMGRRFPPGSPNSRRADVTDDRAAIVLLSTAADTRLEWLRCGEALSEVLLECTKSGLATCALTHVTELPHSREMVGSVSSCGGVPQVLIRIGIAPDGPDDCQATPRRPLSEVLVTRT